MGIYTEVLSVTLPACSSALCANVVVLVLVSLVAISFSVLFSYDYLVLVRAFNIFFLRRGLRYRRWGLGIRPSEVVFGVHRVRFRFVV